MTMEGPAFRQCYTHSMVAASAAFVIVHACQVMIRGLIFQESFKIDPTGFLVLIPYALLEGVVFFVVGYVVAYLPSSFAANRILASSDASWAGFVLFGSAIGIIFLPLCASVPFYAFHLSDDPTYFGRCFEFVLPVIIAGAVGGYLFWNCTDIGERTV